MDSLSSDIKYVVIGNPIKHSKSPQMQNAAFRFHNLGEPYGKLLLEKDEIEKFAGFLRENLAGCNITVPYKEALIPFLDEIDSVALQANSVNTIVNQNGKLTGYSTDGYGLEQSFKVNFGMSIKNNSFIFVGVGGAAQAVAWHFASLGAKRLYLVNRTISKAELLAKKIVEVYPELEIEIFAPNDEQKLLDAIKNSQVLIQATSLGLNSDDLKPFKFELLLENKSINISDLIYHQTPLLEFAEENDFKFCSGKDMLVYQGAKSFEIWTNKMPPIELMQDQLK